MYQLVSAIAKPMGGDTRWESVAIGDLKFPYLYANYTKVYAILSNPFEEADVSLDLEVIRPTVGGLDMTFSDYLLNIGSEALPTSDEIPTLDTKYAKWADAFHAGYDVLPIHPDYAWDSPLPIGEKHWLGLRKKGVDYNLFYRSCLVTVNGFVHLTDTDGRGISVVDGMRSCEISRQNQIGIYSFRELGSLKFVPITPEMVYKQNENQAFKDRFYINVGEDLTDKTVFLVLGGYLHAMDGLYWRTGDGTLGVDMANYSFLERYYESSKYVDMTSLGLGKRPGNEFQVDMEHLYSDEVIKAYATLSQSFVVILDAKDIFVDRNQIERTPNPGSYIAHERPVFPLQIGMGKLAEYWFTYEHPQWAVQVHDSFSHNYNFFTINQRLAVSLDNTRNTLHPTDVGRAFFLKIGKEL